MDEPHSDLVAQRQEFAAAYRQADEQLRVARGTVRTKSLETALWGWRWGRVVNEIHGSPAGPGGPNSAKGGVQKPGTLTAEQTLAYCQELGLATKITSNGSPSGTSTITRLRKVASCVATEDHLRELIGEFGSIWRLEAGLRESKAPRRGTSTRRTAPGYSKFVPPQDWVSYLVQQGLTRSEISAALCISLEALGPEESFKLWDRADRPDRYSEGRS